MILENRVYFRKQSLFWLHFFLCIHTMCFLSQISHHNKKNITATTKTNQQITTEHLSYMCVCIYIYTYETHFEGHSDWEEKRNGNKWHAVVRSLSCVRLFATPWTAARRASLSFTISWGLFKFMAIELMISCHKWHSICLWTVLSWRGKKKQMESKLFCLSHGYREAVTALVPQILASLRMPYFFFVGSHHSALTL